MEERYTDRFEALQQRAGIIAPCHLLLHRVSSTYLIVEPKSIPDDTLIVSSPAYQFFDRGLVELLRRLGGDIRINEKAELLDRAAGKSWNNFVGIEVGAIVSYPQILAPDYQPGIINELAETGMKLFSRSALDAMRRAGMRYSEEPLDYLTPFFGIGA